MDEREQFRRAETIFERAAELDGAEREAYLGRECAGDAALREAVERLLRADAGTLARGLDDGAPVFGLDLSPEELSERMRTPESIGDYKILGLLGEGGMGVVYRAQQQSPARQVALKILRPGLMSRSLLRRFELEASVLARLKHPGIATIFEAGTADTGSGVQPYFAMELIAGRPLTEYAQVHELNTRARLELLAKVCDAVQHAHQRGVIHRDLKPGNILVTEDGQPKVLDFGVARSVNADLRVTTERTDIGQLIGTAPYMSPEQIDGRPDELDTRSDVYALGVVGYELLAGRLPYDLEKRALYEVVRVIREEEPTSLSAVNKTLRGDVETMIAKALSKERERRYQSASDLASDLRRYLSDEPIEARRASGWYQLRKFAKRNRVMVGGIVAVFVVLVAGLIGIGVALARALDAEAEVRGLLTEVQDARDAEREQLEIARREQERASEINQVFKDAILSVTPSIAEGKDTTLMRHVLTEASERFETELADQPHVRAELNHTLGRAYRSISAFDESEASFRKAYELYAQDGGAQDPAALKSLNAIATILGQAQRYEEAEPMHREAIAGLEAAHGPDSSIVLSAKGNLASTLHAIARYPEALGLWEEAAEGYARLEGEDDPETLFYRRLVAVCRMDMGDYATAAPEIERLVERSRRVLGPDDLETLKGEYHLAVALDETGKSAEALPVIERVISEFERLYGEEHFETARAYNQLGRILMTLKNYDKAAEAIEHAAQIEKAIFGEDHQNYLTALGNLTDIYVTTEQFDKAEPLMFEVLASRERTLPEGHPAIANSLNLIGGFYRRQDRFSEAAPYYRRAFEICKAALPPGHFATGVTGGGFGQCLAFMGHFDDAQRELLASYEILLASFGPDHPMVRVAMKNLVDLYQAWDKPEQEQEWMDRLTPEEQADSEADRRQVVPDAGAYEP